MGTATLISFSLRGTVLLPALAGGTVVFKDRFEAKPTGDWCWLREDESDWPMRDGAWRFTSAPATPTRSATRWYARRLYMNPARRASDQRRLYPRGYWLVCRAPLSADGGCRSIRGLSTDGVRAE